METLVFYFKQYLRNHPELDLENDIEEVVNNYMYEAHIHGKGMFNTLYDVARNFNKN